MLDLKFIRENPDAVRKALADRNDTAPLDDILKLDAQRRQKITELEDLRRARKGGDRDKQPISENISATRKVIGKIDKFVDKVEGVNDKGEKDSWYVKDPKAGLILIMSVKVDTDSDTKFLTSDFSARYEREGEPAMALESAADLGKEHKISYSSVISENKGEYTLNTSGLLKILSEKGNLYCKEDVAAFSQKYLASGLGEIAKKVAEMEHVKVIALSGGALVNQYLSNNLINYFDSSDFRVIINQRVPLGDGGSVLGQACNALRTVI